MRVAVFVLAFLVAGGEVYPYSYAPNAPALVVAPARIRQGDPLFAWLLLRQGCEEPRARLSSPDGGDLSETAGFSYPSYVGLRLYGFALGIPSDASPGERVLSLSAIVDGQPLILERRLVVEARAFLSEDIPLSPSLSALRTEPDPRKEEEAAALTTILSAFSPEAPRLLSAMALPVTGGRRSSFFGDRRVYHYAGGGSGASIHAGIDIALPAGTEVRACAAGRVVMARARIVTGNSVVIEHSPGIYSLYYHLESIVVTEGQSVAKGQAIGAVGSTGLATGPHLHWELRIGLVAVDPELLLDAPPLDKEGLIATMEPSQEGR